MIDEFAADWTYRTPLVTVEYPKGWRGVLPPDRQLAARKDRALIPPTVTKRRTRKKAAE